MTMMSSAALRPSFSMSVSGPPERSQQRSSSVPALEIQKALPSMAQKFASPSCEHSSRLSPAAKS